MTSIKLAFRRIFVTGVAAVILSITSCTVTCDAGYEGRNCNTAVNVKFGGVYLVSDTVVSSSGSQVFNYSLTITAPATTPANVGIYNLHNLGISKMIAGSVIWQCAYNYLSYAIR